MNTDISEGANVEQRLLRLEQAVIRIFAIFWEGSPDAAAQIEESTGQMDLVTALAKTTNSLELYYPQVAVDNQRDSLVLAYNRYQDDQKTLSKECDPAITKRFDDAQASIEKVALRIRGVQAEPGDAKVQECFGQAMERLLVATSQAVAGLRHDTQAATLTSALGQLAELKEDMKKVADKAE